MISKNLIKEIRQLEQRKHRRREGLFVAEGPKVVGDLLRSGFEPHLLVATDEWGDAGELQIRQNNRILQNGADSGLLRRVSDDELRRVSFLQHPQQVLGVFHIPQQSELPQPADDRLSLALDGVQDPGNVGTIIRLADWFGIDTIYCSEETADAWNPKVVQATMGSIARVRLYYTDITKLLQDTQCAVMGTVLDGKNIYEEQLPHGGIIVMGNEGNGISQPVRRLLTHRLFIPTFHQGPDRPESLNVAIATAIVCSEFCRRQPV